MFNFRGICRGIDVGEVMPGFIRRGIGVGEVMPGFIRRGMNSPAGDSNPLKRVGRKDLPGDISHLPEDSSSGTSDHAANS
jgi:hypothetical protein